MKGNKIGPIVILIVVLLIGGVMVAKSVMENNLKALTQEQLQSYDISKVKDGVYQGSYSVLPVSATVEVTVKDKSITHIELLKHFNGQGSGGEMVLNQVMVQQDVKVDVVSGVTYSSMVILKAVEDALNEGAGIR